MRKWKWLVAVLLVPAPCSVLASPTSAEIAAAQEADMRGAQMFSYDQAAWHGTDRFQEDIRKSGRTVEDLLKKGHSGYIVEPEKDGKLLVTFYGEREGKRFAFARYEVVGRAVTGGGLVQADGNSALSWLAQRMIDARQIALAKLSDPGHELCSRTPPNTLVLPPRSDGVISVYVLTSTTESGTYPAGGHYRFDFDANGKFVGERRYMTSCFSLAYRDKKGQVPEAVVLTHLLDPQPTEIHVFVSRNIPAPLMIVTTMNRMIWGIANGRVEYVGDVPDEK